MNVHALLLKRTINSIKSVDGDGWMFDITKSFPTFTIFSSDQVSTNSW